MINGKEVDNEELPICLMTCRNGIIEYSEGNKNKKQIEDQWKQEAALKEA